jgi:hypothetical protein
MHNLRYEGPFFSVNIYAFCRCHEVTVILQQKSRSLVSYFGKNRDHSKKGSYPFLLLNSRKSISDIPNGGRTLNFVFRMLLEVERMRIQFPSLSSSLYSVSADSLPFPV